MAAEILTGGNVFGARPSGASPSKPAVCLDDVAGACLAALSTSRWAAIHSDRHGGLSEVTFTRDGVAVPKA